MPAAALIAVWRLPAPYVEAAAQEAAARTHATDDPVLAPLAAAAEEAPKWSQGFDSPDARSLCLHPS